VCATHGVGYVSLYTPEHRVDSALAAVGGSVSARHRLDDGRTAAAPAAAPPRIGALPARRAIRGARRRRPPPASRLRVQPVALQRRRRACARVHVLLVPAAWRGAGQEHRGAVCGVVPPRPAGHPDQACAGPESVSAGRPSARALLSPWKRGGLAASAPHRLGSARADLSRGGAAIQSGDARRAQLAGEPPPPPSLPTARLRLSRSSHAHVTLRTLSRTAPACSPLCSTGRSYVSRTASARTSC
jgi:hypothetical protein